MRCHNCAASPETLNNAKYIVYKNSTLREMEVLEKINKRRRKRFLKNKFMKPRLKTGLLGTFSLISQKQLRNKAAADEGERVLFAVCFG